MDDTIYRQTAIDAFYEMASDIDHLCTVGDYVHVLEMLPPAQPDVPDTNVGDMISRQATIDSLHMHLMYRMGTDSNKKRLDEWINNLPSAHPEIIRCKECKFHSHDAGYGHDWCNRMSGVFRVQIDGREG